MKMPQRTSPLQLACWAGIGSLIAASEFVLGFVNLHHLTTKVPGMGAVPWSRPLLLIACLFPLICGYAISLSAERRLRKGMNEKAWTEQELEPLRLRLSLPVVKWLIGILIAAFGVLILLSACGLFRASMIWALIFPFQIMANVYRLVMPAGRSDSMLLGNNFAPIQSEHWGGRRQAASSSQ
jgi:hypothetical protein